MIFNSFRFLWLFPIVFFVYYAVSYLLKKRFCGKGCNFLLLLLSYALYMQYMPWYAFVLLWVTFITYMIALGMSQTYRYKKMVCWIGVILGTLPLLIFKYYNFFASNINVVLENKFLPGLNWSIPIGISFFTFQAIGYVIDVYKENIKAEQNFLDYALFVSFFPQILSGPISKASELLPQIKSKRTFDYSKVVSGLKMLLWGMFLKTVMADRLGLYVDSVYDNYEFQSGLSCIVASFMYTMQIYGDFAGYSLMAVGVGNLMGFSLISNFKRPYFANSITEFWKRWHISLTRWLTTYVYIGLGGNRCSKIRQYCNIIITFLISGIWHGANWTFMFWGLLHGILQCIEKLIGLDPKGRYSRSLTLKKIAPIRIIMTFIIVDFAWILFRLPSVDVVLKIIKKIFTLEGTGLFLPSNSSACFMLFSIFIVLIKECCEEFFPKIQLFESQYMWLRWISYLGVISIILLCGVFDTSQFIYIKF